MLTLSIAPVAPGTTPETEPARSRCASATIRLQDGPDAAWAQAGERLQATSKSAGIAATLLRYHGSRPTVS